VIAAEGALAMAGPPDSRASAEILPLAGFLDDLARYGITWRIDSLASP
jgi:hypothetical protein